MGRPLTNRKPAKLQTRKPTKLRPRKPTKKPTRKRQNILDVFDIHFMCTSLFSDDFAFVHTLSHHSKQVYLHHHHQSGQIHSSSFTKTSLSTYHHLFLQLFILCVLHCLPFSLAFSRVRIHAFHDAHPHTMCNAYIGMLPS